MSYVIRWTGGVNAGSFDDMWVAAQRIVDLGLEEMVQIREQMSDRVVATLPLDKVKPDIWDMVLEPSERALETANKILGYLPITQATIVEPEASPKASTISPTNSSLDSELKLWDSY